MQYAILTRGVSKRYQELLAVDSLDLEIGEGEFFGLLGPNGAGKTTTVHMLSTLVQPSCGEIYVARHNVSLAPVQVRGKIGLIFQESALDLNLSVKENLSFAAALHGLSPALARRRIAELLALFELSEWQHTPVQLLSGGMRRALDIARGILHRPQVLFLDEPTIGLDVIARRSIWRFLQRLRQRQGVTMLLTTHYMEEAQDCDRVAFLRAGRLTGQGRPSDLIAALCTRVLEIETSTMDEHERLLSPEFGAPVREDGRLLFCLRADACAQVDQLQQRLGPSVDSLRLRAPDLNDVYIWQNRTASREAGRR